MSSRRAEAAREDIGAEGGDGKSLGVKSLKWALGLQLVGPGTDTDTGTTGVAGNTEDEEGTKTEEELEREAKEWIEKLETEMRTKVIKELSQDAKITKDVIDLLNTAQYPELERSAHRYRNETDKKRKQTFRELLVFRGGLLMHRKRRLEEQGTNIPTYNIRFHTTPGGGGGGGV